MPSREESFETWRSCVYDWSLVSFNCLGESQVVIDPHEYNALFAFDDTGNVHLLAWITTSITSQFRTLYHWADSLGRRQTTVHFGILILFGVLKDISKNGITYKEGASCPWPNAPSVPRT